MDDEETKTDLIEDKGSTFFTGDRMDKDIHHSFEEMNNALKKKLSMMYADL